MDNENGYDLTEINEDFKDKKTNNANFTYTLLSKGNFSEVYLYKKKNRKEGQEGKEGKTYALKIINKEKISSYQSNQQIITEVTIQKSIHYPGIVEIKDSFENFEFVFILFEYCQNDTLEQLINKERDPKKLTEKETQCYMLQLIISLNYLHKNNIIHRNLDISNLLLDKDMKLKIGSFRLAYQLKNNTDKCNMKYEKLYIAPEVLKENGYSFEVDIWSLGIIMFQLLTGKYPFIEGYEKNSNVNVDKISSSEMSKAAKDLINQLLVIDPLKRPTLNQIIYHDFFNREGIPKYFSVSTLKQPPEDFSKEILDKDVIFTDLKSIIKPDIGPITYDSFQNLNEIKKNNVKDIDIYIKLYYDYNSKFGIGYLLNNGLVGVNYRDQTKMIFNPKNGDFKYIDKNEEENNYNNHHFPEELNNKFNILKRFEQYFNDICKAEEKKEKNKKLNPEIEENKNETKEVIGLKQLEEKEENRFIYVINILIDDKFIFFKLSNQTHHIFFSDKIQLIMSTEVLTYIDKNKNKCNILLENINDNPIRELKIRYNYIIYKYINSIENNLNKKLEKIKKEQENRKDNKE